jgi:hypothetical protein
MQPIVDFFEKLISEFTWRRMLFVIIILVSGVAGLVLFEWYTASSALTRLEKELKILNQLAKSFQSNGIDVNPLLKDTYDEMAQELNNLAANHPVKFGASPSLNFPEWFRKVLFTLLPWSLLSILLFLLAEATERGKTFGGLIIISIPFILISIFIPTNLVFNQFVYPWGSFALAVGLIFWISKRNGAAKAISNEP